VVIEEAAIENCGRGGLPVVEYRMKLTKASSAWCLVLGRDRDAYQ
jgi:hypothetical protein